MPPASARTGKGGAGLPGDGWLVMHTDSNMEILLGAVFIPLMMAGQGAAMSGMSGETDDWSAVFTALQSGFEPPPAPAVALAADTGVSASDGLTSDGRLAVVPADGLRLEYSTDAGQTWGDAFIAVEGQNAVQVRQADEAGNVSAATRFAFTLDRLQPPVPRVSVRGQDRTFTIADIPADTRVEYSVSGGQWTTGMGVRRGRSSLHVRLVDRAGNVSPAVAVPGGAVRTFRPTAVQQAFSG